MPELVSREEDDVLVIAFQSQKIIADTLITQIGREMMDLLDQANSKVLLDFKAVKSMSSAVIGKVLVLQKECKRHKIDLKLCNISPRIKQVFTTTGLNKVLSIYDTEKEALTAFRKKGWFR